MNNLLKSLAAFQQEVPVIHKGSQGYGYSYADLPAIFEVINPLMKKHGLGFTQSVDGTKLTTTIFHAESGEKIEAAADIPANVDLKGMNAYQVLGSAITYMRRYQLSAMLGLVTDKDTDAATPQTKAPVAQKATIPVPNEASALAAIKAATTLPELQAAWSAHKLEQQLPAVIAAKDARKIELTPKQ